VASAIEISRPVNLPKALRALAQMNGQVRQVSDEEIMEHRAMVARWGFGCEPASAASVAGMHKLLDEKIIGPDETVVCILTGHELKDANATVQYHIGDGPKGALSNRPVPVEDDLDAILRAMGR
jgi:threonine synthase